MQDLIEYYQRELTYLRERGAEFARAYPKVAKRLELSEAGSADPHVERLIEAFAFQTARIQRDLDSEFPVISTALLEMLFPFFVCPTPALGIARFRLEAGNLEAIEVPRHAALYAETYDGDAVYFRTAYTVRLWPVEVAHVEFTAPDSFGDGSDFVRAETALQLKLHDRSGEKFAKIDRLRFFINAEPHLAHILYELIFTESVAAKLHWYTETGASAVRDVTIRPVGFELEDDLLPSPGYAHPGYRLLAEYFAFPEKFLFFEVHLDERARNDYVDLVFLLSREVNRNRLKVKPENFLLGCTPVANLFQRSAEPIVVDHRQTEYRLVADLRRQKITEIHSILDVKAGTPGGTEVRPVRSYYDYHKDSVDPDPRLFWRARRISAPGMAGTDILLSLTDLDLHAEFPAEQKVFVRTLCTNRDLARQLEPGGALFFEKAPQPCSIQMLDRPTEPVWPVDGGLTLWNYLSLQNLNFLAIGEDEAALRSVKAIMNLCSFSTADRVAALRQQDGILTLSRRRSVLRTGQDAWRGFHRGVELTLEMDGEAFAGGDGFLLAAVLERTFAAFVSLQSFIQVVVKRKEEQREWKRWPARTGLRAVL